MRVLYVLPGLHLGGAERNLLDLLTRCDRTLVEPLVCSLMPGGSLRSAFGGIGVPVVELTAGPGVRQLQAMALVPLLVRWRPRIVHSRLIFANVWGRLGRLVDARVISEEQGMEDDRPLRATLINRATIGLSSVIVANATAVAERVHTRDRVPRRRIRVIRNGVDATRFAPARDARPPEFDVISVCRLDPIKGLLDLVDAVDRLAAQRPGLKVVLVGDGPQRAELEQVVRTRGLQSAVHFAGEQSDVAAWLHRARLFVLPSYQEGLPNVILEAMACGLPVVATAVGGTAELVLDGTTGQLVRPRDPEQLTRALHGYLVDDARCAEHGRAARHHIVSHFQIDQMVHAYEQLYRELTA